MDIVEEEGNRSPGEEDILGCSPAVPAALRRGNNLD